MCQKFLVVAGEKVGEDDSLVSFWGLRLTKRGICVRVGQGLHYIIKVPQGMVWQGGYGLV